MRRGTLELPWGPFGRLGAVLLGAILLVGAPIQAQTDDPAPNTEEAPTEELSPLSIGGASPRDLFQSFIESWNLATNRNRQRQLERIDTQDRQEALLRAIRCLETGRESTAVTNALFEQARRVVDVLNYWGKIDYDAIPEVVPGADTFDGFETKHGTVFCCLIDGRWFFEANWVKFRAPWIVEAYKREGAESYQVFSARDFVPDFLRKRALFLEHWQWLGLVTLAILAWIIHRIVIFISRGLISGWLSRHPRGKSSGDAIRAMSVALGFFAAAAILWLLSPHLELQKTGSKVLATITKIVACVGGMLLLYRLADLAGGRLRDAAEKTDSKLDDQLAPMLERSLKVFITVGAVLFVLDNLDVDILSFLAGLGVVGIGVGLAAKDTFANFFGSVTVFADKPFQVGDWIVVGSVEGTVEEIGFRTTRIRTFYNSVVALPNSKLVDSAIDNMGVRRWRRYVTRLGLHYSTPPDRIEAFCEGIRQIVRANERMRQDYQMVYLNEFGASSLEVMVYVFFDVGDWGQELRARQDFMLEILRLAEHLEVTFAYPTTALQIESTPEHPFPAVTAREGDVLRKEVERFGPGGNLARPDGSPSFPRG